MKLPKSFHPSAVVILFRSALAGAVMTDQGVAGRFGDVAGEVVRAKGCGGGKPRRGMGTRTVCFWTVMLTGEE